ncbi:glycosyltransferase [Gilvimarinus algae]|uniref:Glycosyltransferase n=1 Tax=Gilvimarinus algae TaxID=3058037 RepID=A0ABT8TBM8_9GAMM|nr:glycosyltransferase [Gilvimarinus sp. SDUM040014]MDO3381499.1 glycosyltransferase [Gilvimarinus sp. SDUM040014]
MTKPMPTIALILPAYNEAATIAPTIEAFYQALPEARIVVVNNNSADATRSIAEQTLAQLGAKGEVVDELAQGKGNAVRRAFLSVDADVYVLADADLTYPADQVHDLIAPVLEGRADMVVGDRRSGGHYNAENKRRFHNFGNALVQKLVNRLFAARLADIMSGYRAFSRTFVKSYPILVSGFQLETDMTLHSLHRRMRIVEIPIAYRDRPEGSYSKLNTFADGASVIFTIAQILRYYRPLLFFVSFSLLFALAGFIAAIPVFHDWITERYIHHLPLAVLAAAFEIVAFLLLAVGLILDSISHHEKMRTELHQLDLERRQARPEP